MLYFFFCWHIVSEWKKDEKLSAKTLTYFCLQYPLHKMIPPDAKAMMKKAPLHYFRLGPGFDVEKFSSYVLFSLLVEDML